MLSAVIASGHSYRAMLLAEQLIHHRSVHPGPLVLGAAPLKSPAHVLDRDRTVSRRSEPSSRTALIGEQPNPWDVLPPQDATSRHRTFLRRYRRRRLSLHPFRQNGRGAGVSWSPQISFYRNDDHLTALASGSVVTGSCLSTDFPRCCPR